MPRNVRNFWLQADVDRSCGTPGTFASGPVSRTGGMSATLKVRTGGCIGRALDIDCLADEDGTLTIRMAAGDAGPLVWDAETQTLTMTTHRDKSPEQLAADRAAEQDLPL